MKLESIGLDRIKCLTYGLKHNLRQKGIEFANQLLELPDKEEFCWKFGVDFKKVEEEIEKLKNKKNVLDGLDIYVVPGREARLGQPVEREVEEVVERGPEIRKGTITVNLTLVPEPGMVYVPLNPTAGYIWIDFGQNTVHRIG